MSTETVPPLASSPQVKLQSSPLKVVLLLVAQAPKDGTPSAETPTGKHSATRMNSKNATTTSTSVLPVQEHQVTLLLQPTLLLQVNKSSQLKSSRPAMSSMPPTSPTLRPTQMSLLNRLRTGTSLVPSPTRDTKSTNPATRNRTTSLRTDKEPAITQLWMLTGTLTSATANQYTADVQVRSILNSTPKPALRRNQALLTQMLILTEESTPKSKRPSVISSLKPSTDASLPPSTVALTSNTEILHHNH